MLPTKAIRPLCHNCKLELFSLFIHESSSPLSRLRQLKQPRLQLFKSQSRAYRATISRRLENTVIEPEAGSEAIAQPIPTQDHEAAARKARDDFGHTLPANILSSEEYKIYERLYGTPLRQPVSDDVKGLQPELDEEEMAETEAEGELTIYRQNKEGEFEAIENEFEDDEDVEFDEEFEEGEEEEDEDGNPIKPEDERSNKAREALRLDMMAAENKHYSETMEVNEDGSINYGPRTHPYTIAGRYGTEPYSITVPNRTIVKPITEMLRIVTRKQLLEQAQKIFGGPRLQDSVSTPLKPKAEHFQQKPVPLEATQAKMTEMEANAFVAVNLPGIYASATSILVECRKRLGSNWLEELLAKEGGPRILDAGAAGAGVLAWQDILRAEWQRLNPDVKQGDPVPFGKSTVVIGSSELRSRVRLLLDNTTFIPRMPDFVPTRDLPGVPSYDPLLRKQYDVVIAAHSLWTLKEDYMRKAQIQNYFTLLNPNGGVLIILEKGVPRGFELVAGARDTLLKHHISSPGEAEQIIQLTGNRTHKEPGMIIAPCTSHGQCPMYLEPGQMSYRKDWCYFAQRFVRPPFLQDLLGKSRHNHEDIQFSYVAIRRGIDTRPQGQAPKDEALTLSALKGYEKSDVEPNMLSLPRLLLPPLKRHKHVVMDVCTPAGKIERWTTSFSFSRQSYRDGRKARWGDLWALGAKVRVVRTARTGYLKAPVKVKVRGKSRVPVNVDRDDFGKINRNVSPVTSRDRISSGKQPKKKRHSKQEEEMEME